MSPPCTAVGINPQFFMPCDLNLLPLGHQVLPFPFSPPPLGSRTVSLPHVSPQPDLPFPASFFHDWLLILSSLSSESSPLKKTSLSPTAKVAFLSHTRSHCPMYTFLAILTEAVLIPWLVVWPCFPTPCTHMEAS